MATTKNAILRYKVLDRCFRNTGRNYTLDALLSEVNKQLQEYNGPEAKIKRRQLQDDIKFMKSEEGWSIPLKRVQDGYKVYFRYEDSNFSITNEPLSPYEVNTISSALEVLSRFSGAPQFEEIQEVLPILQDRLGLKKQGEREVIGVESNIDLKGLHFLNSIYEAIVKQQVLEVTYQDYNSEEPYIIQFHPYFLKQFNNRWFAIGRNSQNQVTTWNLAIDRMVSIQNTGEEYIECDIDWNDHFYEVIGVTIYDDQPLERVVLAFDSSQAPYIETKPLHPSQKIIERTEQLVVEIKVRPNHELRSLLLSFGASVTVCEPIWLADEMRLIVKRMAQNYN